jgi:hypothetical protein
MFLEVIYSKKWENKHFTKTIKCQKTEGKSQYELDDNIFSIGIGIDVKPRVKHELELEFTWLFFESIPIPIFVFFESIPI